MGQNPTEASQKNAIRRKAHRGQAIENRGRDAEVSPPIAGCTAGCALRSRHSRLCTQVMHRIIHRMAVHLAVRYSFSTGTQPQWAVSTTSI